MPRPTRDVTETEFAILDVLWDARAEHRPRDRRGRLRKTYAFAAHQREEFAGAACRQGLRRLPTAGRRPSLLGHGGPGDGSSPSSSNCWPTAILAVR